jgi:hypothetical protein
MSLLNSCQNSTDYTAKTQYRKFEANIPRKGTARLQSQFIHACFCEQFIYFSDRSAYSAAGMWKLGLRPHNSFSGNIKIQISLQCTVQIFFSYPLSRILLPTRTRSQIKHNILYSITRTIFDYVFYIISPFFTV